MKHIGIDCFFLQEALEGRSHYGIIRYCRNLLRYFILPPGNFRFTLFHPYTLPVNWRELSVRNIIGTAGGRSPDVAHINFRHIPFSRNRSRWMRSLGRYLNETDIEIFFSPFNVMADTALPAVCYIHDIIPLLPLVAENPGQFFRSIPFLSGSSIFFLAETRRILEKARLIIVPSQATAANLKKFAERFGIGYNPERILVNYQIIDEEFMHFKKNPEDLVQLTAKYGLAENYLASAGGMGYRKNNRLLFDAMKFLPEKIRSSFSIAALYALKDQAPACPKNIRQIPDADDNIYRHILSGAKLFIFPSYYEGFGLPPAEALALGIPVLSSNRGSLPEILGNAARYFHPDNPRELADVICEVLYNNSLMEKMTAAGVKIVQKYTGRLHAEKLHEIFGKL